MKVLRTSLVALLAIAAIGGLAFLVRMTQTVDGKLHLQRLADIRAIDSLDVAFNRTLTQGRAGSQANATGERSQVTQQLGEKLDAIDKGPQAIRGLSSELDTALTNFLDTVDSKLELGFDFESRSTLLSQRLITSLDAVPTLTDPVVTAGARADKERLGEITLQLKSDVVNFAMAQTPINGPAITGALEELDKLGAKQTEAYREAVLLLRQRCEEVVADKTELVTLLGGILDRPTAQQLQMVEQAYTAWHESKLAVANQYRLYLAAYAGTLLLVLAYLGVRLLRSYRQLDRANDELSHTNERLEEQVQVRTKDLSTALTNLRASQAQLVQSEKMASLGQMVAGVAHEINTPLGYARSNTEIVRSSLTEIRQLCAAQGKALGLITGGAARDEEIAEAVTQAHSLGESLNAEELAGDLDNLLADADHGLTQVADLVASLKDFSRVDRSRTDLFNVNDGLDSALKIAHNQLKHRVEVVRSYGKLPQIECSPSQLNQVFLNLLTNAGQAIGDKGKIYLHTSVEKDNVAIRILDNGCGMTEDVRKRIFEPFFTTKPVGKGTGLGLSIVYRIVEDHGGRIAVRSTPGKGSEFTVHLPLRQAQAAAAADRAATALAAAA
jgi:signal transduction histidine kinase